MNDYFYDGIAGESNPDGDSGVKKIIGAIYQFGAADAASLIPKSVAFIGISKIFVEGGL